MLVVKRRAQLSNSTRADKNLAKLGGHLGDMVDQQISDQIGHPVNNIERHLHELLVLFVEEEPPDPIRVDLDPLPGHP